MDHPFRSAALGGFNKQDVLAFLEAQAAQAAAAQQELKTQLEAAQKELSELRRERDELSAQLDQARGELERGSQEREALTGQLEQTGRALAEGREQAGRTGEELEQLLRERDGLLRELDVLRPDAQAYRELKERTAGVELEAHRRAQAIQEKAQSDASRLRRELEQWLQCLRREYGGLCASVEATVAHAASQLGRAGDELDQLLQLVGGQDEALDGLERICDSVSFGRPDAPRRDD